MDRYLVIGRLRFFDYCGFLFEMITDAPLSYETQVIVQKSMFMKKQACFCWKWSFGSPYGVLTLGCSKKTNKIAAGDDQKVLQGCLAKWYTK